jgi:N-acetylated-alpha-linked acidic dipeptidase
MHMPIGNLLALALILTAAAFSFGQAPLRGYTPAAAAHQREIEKQLAEIPDAQRARTQHRYLTAEPHPAGSQRNNELAEYIAEQWRQQGWEDVRIHRYDVLVSFPREVSLEMVAPVAYKATLREEPYDADPDSKNGSVRGSYFAMSRSGELTAPVVYSRGGNPEDYEVLRQNGIDVRGKIVLVRYSNPYSYRGFKALTAERMGAAAILIYSDPAEDGYKKGSVYPHGPWGPESHIQRGAITYDFMVAGDPLTPGWASVPDAKKISIDEAISMPKIIGLPLSWKDAKPLLENMDGPIAPKTWQGGLPLTYRMGGNVRVHLKVDMNTSIQPNYVVEARIRGAEFPDEWIVMGNHRDGWEFGGVDPSSGTAAMLEFSRAAGEMLKRGVRPRRTLVLCSWDGEEVGLTGSTEWGEQFADELKKKAAAYINVDSAASGPRFDPSAVASLAPVVLDVATTLRDPKSGSTLYEAREADVRSTQKSQSKRARLKMSDLIDTHIGSGSDHTVFLNHLGIPTIGLGFDGPYGVYHSAYDNFFWMNTFGDPGYRYHRAMAQLWGVLAYRLANADLLPLDFDVYGNELRRFVIELRSANPKAKVDLTALLKEIDGFTDAGRKLKETVHRALTSGAIDVRRLSALNSKFRMVEANWLNPDGIPGRPWFQHTLYAARYTYAHLELPGITEAVERADWTEAERQAAIVRRAVARNTAVLLETEAELAHAARLKSVAVTSR